MHDSCLRLLRQIWFSLQAKEFSMHTRYLAILALAISTALSGCASSGSYQPGETSAGSSSGITVYGEIDASVGRVR